MKRFARLNWDLDDARDSEDRIRLVAEYFKADGGEDQAWDLKLLIDRSTKRLVGVKLLKETAFQVSGLPEWLFERSVADVGDVAEAAALILETEPANTQGGGTSQWMRERVLPLSNMDPTQQSVSLAQSWSLLGPTERFVFNKLVLGILKPAATREEVLEGYARSHQIPVWAIHLRLADPWTPSHAFYFQFRSSLLSDVGAHRPYRLPKASVAAADLNTAGWHIEPKWDGVRVQAIRRAGKTSLWLKSESLVSNHFPEISESMESLPDGTVLDGIIVAWATGKPQPAATVRNRLERKPSSKRQEAPISLVFIAFDILESGGEDVRARPFEERRVILGQLRTALVPPLLNRYEHKHLSALTDLIFMSEAVAATDLSHQLDEVRASGADGLVLKRLDSCYGTCEDEDTWLVLKSESKTLIGVLLYVERGAAGQIDQVTVGVWRGEELVPIAKVQAVFTLDEAAFIEAFVKENTLERFGPVRTVRPEIVIEIAYDGVEPASRRKAGISLRSPRMIGIRSDLITNLATRLESLTRIS